MRQRTRKWLMWELAAAMSVVVLVVAVLVVLNRDGDLEPGTARPATPAPTAAPRSPWHQPVLVVKIDNVRAARPQTGLASADVVYVEPVEGGLTRLVAVYAGDPPATVGPVRSARRTDIELLAQYGTPALAYSGAAPELLPALRSADIVNASPAQAPSAFHRNGDRPAPHNLYVRPAELPGGGAAPAKDPLLTGAAPAGGVPTARLDVGYAAARYSVTWSARDGRWLITMDGTPVVSTESGRLTVETVVRQEVRVTNQAPVEDARGNSSPVARTVGTGEAVVLRDGKRFAGTWSRPTPLSPTRFHTTDGRALPVAAGPVWVFLSGA